MHGDRTHGINDLRSFYINNRKQINVYADKFTSKYLINTFSYILKVIQRISSNFRLNKLPKKLYTTNNRKKLVYNRLFNMEKLNLIVLLLIKNWLI